MEKPKEKVKEVKELEHTFSLREQILANAYVLWPIIQAKSSRSRYRSTQDPPALAVILNGTGTDYAAKVVRPCPGDHKKRYEFINSGTVGSADAAIRQLFETTTMMLNQENSKRSYFEPSMKWVEVAGGSGYYVWAQ